jgi:hypothetical protein
MKTFAGLSYRGQVGRLRRLAHAGLTQYELSAGLSTLAVDG